MNLTTKKIIAREFIMILVSTIICLLAFSCGYILDNQYKDNLLKMEMEVENYESQIDNYINAFRKNPQVDSLYKSQMEFYNNYQKAFGFDSSDYGNYFFWINVRKSIKDSTFNFSYAKDEFVSRIGPFVKGDKTRKLWEILQDQKTKRLGGYQYLSAGDIKSEFKYFAIKNKFERFLSIKDWKKYEDIRLKKRNIENKIKNNYDYKNLEGGYLEIAFTLCISLFFILRYLYYIILWSIKILKQKQQ